MFRRDLSSSAADATSRLVYVMVWMNRLPE